MKKILVKKEYIKGHYNCSNKTIHISLDFIPDINTMSGMLLMHKADSVILLNGNQVSVYLCECIGGWGFKAGKEPG